MDLSLDISIAMTSSPNNIAMVLEAILNDKLKNGRERERLRAPSPTPFSTLF
jgi:hypothetical protein